MNKAPLLSVVCLMLLASGLRANMANPMRPGNRLGEPSGELRKLHIEHEDLRIDLRPLADLKSAEIAATYAVRNDSTAHDVELVFVGVDMENGQYSITFDGAPVTFNAVRDQDLTLGWRVPESEVHDYYDTRAWSSSPTKNALRFTLHVTPGQHRIVVRYRASVTEQVSSRTVITWKCFYILAPARQWASFGTLHTSVLVPEGWPATVDDGPALKQEGDSLTGVSNGIYADLLAISLHKPTGILSFIAEAFASYLSLMLFLIVIVRYAMKLGKIVATKKRSAWRNLAGVLLYCTAATILMCVLIMTVPPLLVNLEAGDQAAHLHYYGSFMIILIAPVVIVIAMLVVGAIASIRSSRLRRLEPLQEVE